MAQRGRPFEPGNKFGRGRPRGSRNKISGEARRLLEEYSEPLMRKAIAEALKATGPMHRLLVTQLLGLPKPAPVAIGKLPTANAEDVSKASQTVVNKTALGEVTVEEGQALLGILEQRRKAIVTLDHERRLQDLEVKP